MSSWLWRLICHYSLFPWPLLYSWSIRLVVLQKGKQKLKILNCRNWRQSIGALFYPLALAWPRLRHLTLCSVADMVNDHSASISTCSSSHAQFIEVLCATSTWTKLDLKLAIELDWKWVQDGWGQTSSLHYSSSSQVSIVPSSNAGTCSKQKSISKKFTCFRQLDLKAIV